LDDDEVDIKKDDHGWDWAVQPHQPLVCKTYSDHSLCRAVSSTELVVLLPEALIDHFHSGFLDAVEKTQQFSENLEGAEMVEVGNELRDDAFCEASCILSSPSSLPTGPEQEARSVDVSYLREEADGRPVRGALRAQELVQRVLRRLDTLEQGRAAEAASRRHEATAIRRECMQAARCLTCNVVRRALHKAEFRRERLLPPLLPGDPAVATTNSAKVEHNGAAPQYSLE
jgi:hypothetical protein